MAGKDWTDDIDFTSLMRELDDVPHGKRKAYQEQKAEALGISYATLRREITRRFGKTKNVEREEQVPEDLVHLVARIKEEYKTMTLKGDGRTLSTADAQEIAASEGYESAMDWHESTINAALRRRGYHVKTPRRRIEASYAGQQFQMDFSRSKHFQIEEPIQEEGEGSGDWLLKATARELHYKNATAKVRAWIAQLRDEYSRLRLIRYYPATAESAMLGMHFLRWCFQRSEDDHLMRELPERLKVDTGSFGKSKLAQRGLDRLDVDLRLTSPGNARSQGKVERGFRTLWGYEAKIATRLLRSGETHIRLSRLRTLVHRLTIEEQTKRHPVRRHKTRGALYQQSLLRQPMRTVGTDLRDLFTRSWERRADETAMISIENRPYQVPAFAAGNQVLVHRRSDGKMVGELMDGWRAGDPFPVEPYEFEDLDDYSGRPAQTYAQEIAEEAREAIRERKQAREDGDVRRLKPADPEEVAPPSPFEEAEETDGDRERILQIFEARARASRRLRRLNDNLSREQAAGISTRLAQADILHGGMEAGAVDAAVDDIVERMERAKQAKLDEETGPTLLPLDEALGLLDQRLQEAGIQAVRRRPMVRLAEDQGLIYDDMPKPEVEDAFEAVTEHSGPFLRSAAAG